MQVLAKWIQLSRNEKAFLAEAIFFLFYAKILLLFPLKYGLKKLKPAETLKDKGTYEKLILIKSAIHRANKLALWQNVCLVKSFAARFMLQRRGIGSVLYLGLQMKGHKQLVAHAWLMVDGVAITPRFGDQYKEIFSI